MDREDKTNEITPRLGVEIYNYTNLPGKYKNLMNSFRKSSSDIRYYSDNANCPTNESWYPSAEEMDNFVVFTGEQQPSLANPQYREIVDEILSPEFCLSDFKSPLFSQQGFNSELWEKDFGVRNWKAMVSTLPKNEIDINNTRIGTLLFMSDNLTSIFSLFRGAVSGYSYMYDGGYSKEYAKLFKQLKERGELRPEDIFYSTISICAWNSEDNKFGTYFSDPEPVVRLKNGEYPFYQLIEIVDELYKCGKEFPEVSAELFEKGSLATREEVIEQIWQSVKPRLELLHVTEFTDPTILTLSNMPINAKTGITLSGAVAKAQEIIKEKGGNYRHDNKFPEIHEVIADWDNFVLGVDRSKVLRLSTSAVNPTVREGASTAIMLASAVAKGEDWRMDASVANVMFGEFQKSVAESPVDPDATLLNIFGEIGIETKQELLTKSGLKKVIEKLEKKHKDLLPRAFSAAVKSGIKISAEVLNEVGINIPDSFYDDIRRDPNMLVTVVGQIKELMVKFHPDAQIRNANLYADPRMKKLADDGHIALKNLYEWYDTVRKNYQLITE